MKSKITFNKSGSGSKSGRLTIPVAFLEVLKITEDDREVNLTLNNNKIIIEKTSKNNKEFEQIDKRIFRSVDEIAKHLDINEKDKLFLEEEFSDYINNNDVEIVEGKHIEPFETFQVECSNFTYIVGITQFNDTYIYWVMNIEQAKLYKENIHIVNMLQKAIDLVQSNSNSSNCTDRAIEKLYNIIDNGFYDKATIEDCKNEILKIAKYSGYTNIQSELLKEILHIYSIYSQPILKVTC